MSNYPKIAKLKTPAQFADHCRQLQTPFPIEEALESAPTSPLAAPIKTQSHHIGNRFCILPMEGWDGTTDGKPTELTQRRWENFGRSGAKLICGGEAVAVHPDGRANPHQLLISPASVGELAKLRERLVAAHAERFQSTDDLSIGLQLTHSGRFAKPQGKQWASRTGYAHPLLDKRFGTDPKTAILSDAELWQLIENFVTASRLAEQAGFSWVDIKHCHGYLGHELLSGFDRLGEFGGSFENRTRFLRNIVAGIQAESPCLKLGVRLSAFDFIPFIEGSGGVGQPTHHDEYSYAFGGDGSGIGIDLTEPIRFVQLMETLGIELLCTTAGSPYYNPHIQRPAAFPPSDGYLPPEDPLLGVFRQMAVTRELKSLFPQMVIVGSGYSYLQDWLPHVAQGAVRQGWTDSVGIGRMVLSYPELPTHVLQGRPLQRELICRTFSECTTAPRHGLVSGCYPLDPFYKSRPEHAQLVELKAMRKNLAPTRTK